MLAARLVSLHRAVRVVPVGIAMGLIVIVDDLRDDAAVAIVLMVPSARCAGFFVVPMNALLQHRGHMLMGAGHSIAVQNFNENIGVLAMLGLYALMVKSGLDVNTAIVIFGVTVAGCMTLVRLRHTMNQRQADSLHLIGMDKPQNGHVAAPVAPPAGRRPPPAGDDPDDGHAD